MQLQKREKLTNASFLVFPELPQFYFARRPLQTLRFELFINISISSGVNMIKECSAIELKEKLNANEKFQFIDCRENQEWLEAHIAGATLLPLSELEAKFPLILADKNSSIVIQCRSGARSMKACVFLLSKGYTNLTNVEGGIMSWMKEGFPVITE